MPYVVEYPADQVAIARATSAAYGAQAYEEQRRFQAQQDLADQEMAYRWDQQAIDANQRQQQLDQSSYQFNAGLSQQIYRDQADNQLAYAGLGLQQQNIDQNWVQLEQQRIGDEMNFAGQQARANATLQGRNLQIVAQKAAEAQRQNFERAMFLDGEIEKRAREGWFTNQAQYNEAKADVFRQTGIESGAIQREFMDRQQADTQQKRTAALGSYSKLTGLTPDELESMVVDNGNGEFVLADPKFVESMARAKMDNSRLLAITDQNNAAKVKTATATAQANYQQRVSEQRAKAQATFRQLKEAEAKARSTKADIATGTKAVNMRPEDLPPEVLKRLAEQALMENPMPPLPPGM